MYCLRATPWLVPGLSVETHLAGLLELQSRLERGEPLSFFAGKYLIEAERPWRTLHFIRDQKFLQKTYIMLIIKLGN